MKEEVDSITTVRLLDNFIEYLAAHCLQTTKIKGITTDYFDLQDVIRLAETYIEELKMK